MLTKRTLCALMCAILLVTAVVPALAASDSYDTINIGLGVRITCTSYLGTKYAKSTLNLSFVSGVNHFPQSDYVAKAEATVHYPSGSDYDYAIGNMSAIAKADVAPGDISTFSEHAYTVNGSWTYPINLP